MTDAPKRIGRIYISAQTAERMARGTSQGGQAKAVTNPQWRDVAYVLKADADLLAEALRYARDNCLRDPDQMIDEALAAYEEGNTTK